MDHSMAVLVPNALRFSWFVSISDPGTQGM
jgi:hypothetical protein